MSYAEMQRDKFDVEKFNRENMPEEKNQAENSPYQKWYGIIMLLAVMFFLVTGLAWNMWHINWIAFLVGGLLCGIVGIIESSSRK